MLDICGLLNRGGGVVLFFVQQHYLEKWAIGRTIIQSKKGIYKNLIEEQIRYIYPKVEIGREIVMSFVPLVKHPYDFGVKMDVMDEQARKTQRYYIQGLYVFRIAVFPSQGEKLYYYQNGDEIVSSVFEKGGSRLLKGEQLVNEMRSKMQYFCVGDQGSDQDEQMSELLSKECTMVERGHRCVQPYDGMPIQVQQLIRSSAQKKYRYMSMVVTHSSNFDSVVKKLN